jgi:hypothetical protein
MITMPIIFAKLAALYKETKARSDERIANDEIYDYVNRFRELRTQVIDVAPDLYSDIPNREDPLSVSLSYPKHFFQLIRDLEYIFEVRANSELRPEP